MKVLRTDHSLLHQEDRTLILMTRRTFFTSDVADHLVLRKAPISLMEAAK